MESLAERTVLLTDDIRLDFLEGAREELTNRSRRKWALIAVALVLGATAAAVAIALILRRAATTSDASDDGAAEAPKPAR